MVPRAFPTPACHSLNDVGLTDEGAKKLLEAVNNCPSLIWLPVDKNGLSDDVVQQLATAVKKNEEPGRKQLGACRAGWLSGAGHPQADVRLNASVVRMGDGTAASKRKQALQSAMAAQDAREKAKRALKEVADNAAKA